MKLLLLCVEGFFAVRGRGSWFLEELVFVFELLAHEMDIINLLTEVCHMLSSSQVDRGRTLLGSATMSSSVSEYHRVLLLLRCSL